MAFDDLLFMKFSGHCHYFQKEELKLSLIILAAKSDYIICSPFRSENTHKCATNCTVLQELV